MDEKYEDFEYKVYKKYIEVRGEFIAACRKKPNAKIDEDPEISQKLKEVIDFENFFEKYFGLKLDK